MQKFISNYVAEPNSQPVEVPVGKEEPGSPCKMDDDMMKKDAGEMAIYIYIHAYIIIYIYIYEKHLCF